jgi:glycosyltransferase involved in cell wall biosynthesis
MIENITVIVPVKNEEKNLASCLASIKDFVNVIVVDSNSSDRTPQITAEFSQKTQLGSF